MHPVFDLEHRERRRLRRASAALVLTTLVLVHPACSSDFERSRVNVPTDAAWSVDAPIGGAGGAGPDDLDARHAGDTRVNEAAPFDAPGSDTANPHDAGADSRNPDAGRDAASDARPADAKPDTSNPPDATADARRDVITGDPDCSVVSCASPADHSCCRDAYGFALNEEHKPEPSLITSFTIMSTAWTGNFRFDGPAQVGALGFNFPVPHVPAVVRMVATWTGPVGRPFVTLEAPGAGCAYPFGATWEADLNDPLYCWGGSFTPDAVHFRVESTAAGDARLSITRVELR